MPALLPSEYVIYIATGPERLWEALVNNALRVELRGTVLAAQAPQKLVYECRAVWNEESADDLNRLSFEIEAYRSLVRLAFTYEASERLVTLARPGWPAVFSSLKSLLETGKPLDLTEVFGPERNPANR